MSHTRTQQRSSEVKRFSRASVLETLNNKIGYLESYYGFDSGWGWARVEGRDTEVVVSFGRYQALLDLREEIES